MRSISVVIPEKNESRYIRKCIDSVIKQREIIPEIEILVIDNGSTDNTIEILRNYGEKIVYYVCPDRTVSEMRNFGANMSSGEWLAFIDGDIEVDKYWISYVEKVLREIKKNGCELKNVVTGATCMVPENNTWVERVWHTQLTARDKERYKYINSGNMIVHRHLFELIGGFDSGYRTGEDVKFCRDAKAKGGKIFKDDRIRAVHHGYPKTILQFFNRERWHGLSMRDYIVSPWKSKELSYALYIYMIIALIIVLAVKGNLRASLLLGPILLLLPGLCFAIFRSRNNPIYIFPLAYLYFVYGLARGASIFDILCKYDKERKKN